MLVHTARHSRWSRQRPRSLLRFTRTRVSSRLRQDDMADLIKVSLLGTLPSGEEWSVNPVYRLNAQNVDVSFAQLTAIATAIDAITLGNSLRNLWSVTTALTGCRVEARTNEGALEGLAEHTRALPVVGLGSTPHPFQTAAVVSLRTPLAGASGRGRVYWPATGVQITPANLRMESSQQGFTLTGTKTFFADIKTAITASVPDVILAVWSRKLNTTLGVTRMLVGDVLDTQRRRRDTLVESYMQVDIP